MTVKKANTLLLTFVMILLPLLLTSACATRLKPSETRTITVPIDETNFIVFADKIVAQSENELLYFISGFKSSSPANFYEGSDITQIFSVTLTGESELVGTIDNSIVYEVIVGDEIILVKSYVGWPDEYTAKLIALDRNTLEELWRYDIDLYLNSYFAVGNYVVVESFSPFGVDRKTQGKLIDRVMFDNTGTVISRTKPSNRIVAASDMLDGRFYIYTYSEIQELDTELNILKSVSAEEITGFSASNRFSLRRGEGNEVYIFQDYSVAVMRDDKIMPLIDVHQAVEEISKAEDRFYPEQNMVQHSSNVSLPFAFARSISRNLEPKGTIVLIYNDNYTNYSLYVLEKDKDNESLGINKDFALFDAQGHLVIVNAGSSWTYDLSIRIWDKVTNPIM